METWTVLRINRLNLCDVPGTGPGMEQVPSEWICSQIHLGSSAALWPLEDQNASLLARLTGPSVAIFNLHFHTQPVLLSDAVVSILSAWNVLPSFQPQGSTQMSPALECSCWSPSLKEFVLLALRWQSTGSTSVGRHHTTPQSCPCSRLICTLACYMLR